MAPHERARLSFRARSAMSPGGFPRLPGVQSDNRLIALAREGDERAFEALVRRHSRPLLRYCRRMGLSDSRAEDVVQQALLRAWLALGRGGEVHAPKAWLYRTVHNTAVNAVRSARDHGPLDDDAPVELAPSAESDFERRSAVRQALSHVAALPQMQRDAILLTAVDGRSHEEIASALGVTHGAVRGLLYRARATLRDAAAAVVPQPALLWASGLLSRVSPTATRLAELSAPAGNSDVGGMIAKGAALAASAAVLAVGSGIVTLPRHLAHRSKTAVLALGMAPATAAAQESESATTPSRGALNEPTSPSASRPSGHRGGSESSRPRSTRPARRTERGADGADRPIARMQPTPPSDSGRGSSDAGQGHGGEDGLTNAPSGSSGPGSDGSQAAGPSLSDPSHDGQAVSECDHCSEASAGSGGDAAAPKARDAQPSQVVPAVAPEPRVRD